MENASSTAASTIPGRLSTQVDILNNSHSTHHTSCVKGVLHSHSSNPACGRLTRFWGACLFPADAALPTVQTASRCIAASDIAFRLPHPVSPSRYAPTAIAAAEGLSAGDSKSFPCEQLSRLSQLCKVRRGAAHSRCSLAPLRGD